MNPIDIKVDRIAASIHVSHMKPGTCPLPADHPSSSMKKTSNPLKLKITWQYNKDEEFPDPDEGSDSDKA